MSREDYEQMEAEDAIERARDEQDERDEAWPPRDEPDNLPETTWTAPVALAPGEVLPGVPASRFDEDDEEPW
jgi:hypothetical protein